MLCHLCYLLYLASIPNWNPRPQKESILDALADKRFNVMVDQLKKVDEQYERFDDIYQTAATAQIRFYNIQADFAQAQFEKFKRDNNL